MRDSFRLTLETALVPIIILVLIFGITACVSAPSAKSDRQPLAQQSEAHVDIRAWEEGMQAFKNREYDKASTVFDFLRTNAETGQMRMRSLYALACTRLILAHTQDEFENAVALWDSWNQSQPDLTEAEDPRMLTPFIELKAQQKGTDGSAARALNSDEKVVSYKDLAAYKNLLQAKEKELERVKARLSVKEKEVRHLKSQIDSLEAIHLKIQEKKKEISSP